MKKLCFVFAALLLACSCNTLAPSGDSGTEAGDYYRLASAVEQWNDESSERFFMSSVYTEDSRTGRTLLESFNYGGTTLRYMYALPSFVYIYEDEAATCQIKLNADGLVSSVSSSEYNTTSYYEYDEASRLKKKTYQHNGRESVCYNFSYSEDGNMKHIHVDYQYDNKPDEWELSIGYTDIPAKTAPLQILNGDMFLEIFDTEEWALMEAGFFGDTFPNLLIQNLTETGLDGDMSVFSYKLDKNGYVSEMTMVNSCDDSTAPDVVTCNFTWEKSSAPSYAQWHLNEKSL